MGNIQVLPEQLLALRASGQRELNIRAQVIHRSELSPNTKRKNLPPDRNTIGTNQNSDHLHQTAVANQVSSGQGMIGDAPVMVKSSSERMQNMDPPCILTDVDLEQLQRSTPFTRHGAAQLASVLASPNNLDRLKVAELQAVIRYINKKQGSRVGVSGPKHVLIVRLSEALYPRSARSSNSPSTPTIHPAHSSSTAVTKSIVIPPSPASLNRVWSRLHPSYHLRYDLIEEVASIQFVHQKSGSSEVRLDIDTTKPSQWKQRLEDQKTRFLLFVYSEPSKRFVTSDRFADQLRDSRDFSMTVDGLLVANIRSQKVSDTIQYIDITSRIKEQGKSPGASFEIKVCGPAYYWPSGLVSLLCVEENSMDKVLVRLYEQSLRNAGVTDLPNPPELPNGFGAFRKSIFSTIEEAEAMFTSRVVSKLNRKPSLNEAKDDEDIQMGNQIISFQCPLSLIRIKIPCRSRKCRHRQCFDGETFMKLNLEIGGKWKCAVCATVVSLEDLEVDAPFARLLSKYEQDDKCIILPSGEDVAYFEETPEPSGTPRKGVKRKSCDVVIDLDDEEEHNESEKLVKKRRMIKSPPKRVLPEWNGCVIEID